MTKLRAISRGTKLQVRSGEIKENCSRRSEKEFKRRGYRGWNVAELEGWKGGSLSPKKHQKSVGNGAHHNVNSGKQELVKGHGRRGE